MELGWLGLVVALALAFAVTNGVKDTGNAIATSVASRALTPLVAVRTATVANLVGAFLGLGIVEVLSDDVVAPPSGADGLVVLAAALGSAILWNLLTWWQGLPTSSTHAMIGGLIGAAVVGGGTVLWDRFTVSVILPLLLSPASSALCSGSMRPTAPNPVHTVRGAALPWRSGTTRYASDSVCFMGGSATGRWVCGATRQPRLTRQRRCGCTAMWRSGTCWSMTGTRFPPSSTSDARASAIRRATPSYFGRSSEERPAKPSATVWRSTTQRGRGAQGGLCGRP